MKNIGKGLIPGTSVSDAVTTIKTITHSPHMQEITVKNTKAVCAQPTFPSPTVTVYGISLLEFPGWKKMAEMKYSS